MPVLILKLIATVTMFIDHTGAAFAPFFDTTKLRIIGRIAFPIYAFLIAEGCRHTKNIKKYLLRLFIFALISEVPYDLFHSITDNPFSNQFSYFNLSHQNVFFTLFLGALAIYLYELIKPKDIMFAFTPFLVCASIAYILKTDYDLIGVCMIFAAYLCKNRAAQAFSIFAGVFWLYAVEFQFSAYGLWLTAFGSIACLLILLYNGKSGIKITQLKWTFYLFYPLHLLAIFFVFLYVRAL